jgi:uncharacterized protein YggE
MKRFLYALALAAPVTVSAQQTPTPPERTVTVNANAMVEREPERAVILLAVESPATTAQQAAAANATKMTALMAALRRVGISGPNVRTVSYELQPQYANERPMPTEQRQGPPRIVGYRAINMVQVTVDTVARAGGVIDSAIAAGANRVAGLSFELRDPQSARNEALRLAVARARGEAEALAEAAGQRLGVPLNISTGGYAVPRFARDMSVSMEMAQAAPTPIEGGTLAVHANVTIVYKLENR